MSREANHIALRDSDAPFIEEIVTRRAILRRQWEDGEWTYWIHDKLTGEERAGGQGYRSVAAALGVVLEGERRTLNIEDLRTPMPAEGGR